MWVRVSCSPTIVDRTAPYSASGGRGHGPLPAEHQVVCFLQLPDLLGEFGIELGDMRVFRVQT